MKIWIIGGTSESTRLVKAVDRKNLIVSIATEDGKEFLPKDIDLHIGPMNQKEMANFIQKNHIVAAIDMTHPFAKIVSGEVKEACQQRDIPYFRHARHIETSLGDIIFPSYDTCIHYIAEKTGTFFFTTGSKFSESFEAVKGNSRHIYRIIPSEGSIAILKEAGVQMKDIVAMLGPFDYDMNLALFKHYDAEYLVTKNSGEGSGFKEKIKAAKDLGITTLVIATESEDGYSFGDIKNIVERLSHEIFLSLL